MPGGAVKGSVWIGVLARRLGQTDFRRQLVDLDRGEARVTQSLGADLAVGDTRKKELRGMDIAGLKCRDA
ncbi:hypothetical protein [Nocardia xishanensis]|uniref:Uncharacterized protein n=1 Tax=Nocardia xishanensis TaxID=238964 RepID=A0ABW7XBV7_9NOCA